MLDSLPFQRNPITELLDWATLELDLAVLLLDATGVELELFCTVPLLELPSLALDSTPLLPGLVLPLLSGSVLPLLSPGCSSPEELRVVEV